jgi:hypothetical protein
MATTPTSLGFSSRLVPEGTLAVPRGGPDGGGGARLGGMGSGGRGGRGRTRGHPRPRPRSRPARPSGSSPSPTPCTRTPSSPSRSTARATGSSPRSHAAGFTSRHGVAGLDTAFVATAGSGPLTIAICAEYDALPGIGHACGHNVIAAAAVGAGIALAPLADELGLTVKVMGTPAEEGGGGKILMLDAGVFDGVHAAMMVHPAPSSRSSSRASPSSTSRHLPRPRGARVRLPAARTERRRRAHRRAGRRRPAAPAPRRRRSASTASSPTAVTHPTSSRAARRARGTCVPRRSPSSKSCRRACTPASRPARSRPAARSRSSSRARATASSCPTRRCSPPTSARRPRSDASSPSVDPSELAGLDRHGERVAARPDDPPDARHRDDGAVNHQPGFTAAAARPSADRAMLDGAMAMARTVIAVALDEGSRTQLISAAR